MKILEYEYKLRALCPYCYSLSIKKSYKEYTCNKCNKRFLTSKKSLLLHKNGRCIDNNVESRIDRYNPKTNKIIYE